MDIYVRAGWNELEVPDNRARDQRFIYRGGLPGLVIAGATFIFPAVVITLVFAWLYVNYGSIPSVEPFFFGIKPAVLAVILSAVYRLGQNALKGWKLGVIGAGVLTVVMLGVNEIKALLAGGIMGMLWLFFSDRETPISTLSVLFPAVFATFLKKGKSWILVVIYLVKNDAMQL